MDFSNFIGGDPNSIDWDALLKKALSGQEGDPSAARRAGLLSAGLGILANAHKGFSGAVGEGGLLGVNAYSAERQRQQKDPMQQIGLANALMSLRGGLDKQAALRDWQGGMMPGGGPQIPNTPTDNSGYMGDSQAAPGPSQFAQMLGRQQQTTGGMPPVSYARALQGSQNQYPEIRDPAKILLDLFTKTPHNQAGGEAASVYNPATGSWDTGPTMPKLDAGQAYSNGQINNIPGYTKSVAETATAQTGAQEAGKAAFDVISIPDGRGGMMRVRRSAPINDAENRAAAQRDFAQSGGNGPMNFTPSNLGVERSPESVKLAEQQALMQGELSKSLASDAYKTQMSDLKESYKSANTAKEVQMSINEARSALDNPAIVGGLGKTKIAGLNVINGILPTGLAIAPEMLGNSQRLASALGQQLVKHAKDLGFNPSNADATRLEKVIGDEGLSEKGIRAILDFQEKMARGTITRHNSIADQAESKGAAPLFSYKVDAPEIYKRGSTMSDQAQRAEAQTRRNIPLMAPSGNTVAPPKYSTDMLDKLMRGMNGR